MKVPGEAWLQFEARPAEGDKTLLTQTAFLAPKGLLGFLYWYGLYPFHGLIFGKMIDRLSRAAEAWGCLEENQAQAVQRSGRLPDLVEEEPCQ